MNLDYELEWVGFSKITKEIYIFYMRKFLTMIKKSPSQATKNDVKKFLQDLSDEETLQAVAALRFLFNLIRRKSISLPKIL